MKVKVIGTLEAKTRLSEQLQTVQRGQRYYIAKHGKPIAELAPFSAGKPRRKAGFAKGTFTHVAPDFDAPVPYFEG